jgi:hypothetical protein
MISLPRQLTPEEIMFKPIDTLEEDNGEQGEVEVSGLPD